MAARHFKSDGLLQNIVIRGKRGFVVPFIFRLLDGMGREQEELQSTP